MSFLALPCALRCYRGDGVSMRCCLRLGLIDAQLFAHLGALQSATCQRAFRQHRSRLGLKVSIKGLCTAALSL